MSNQPTAVVSALLDTVYELESSGCEVKLRELKAKAPGHSDRDYQKALDLFKEQKLSASACSLPMDDGVRRRLEQVQSQMWGMICSHFEQLKQRYEQECARQIEDARLARDESQSKAQTLGELLEQQGVELNTKITEIEDLRKELAKAKDELAECRLNLNKVIGENSAYKHSLEALSESMHVYADADGKEEAS
ncbi:MAG: hypothetical protein IJ228_13565 [Succinivibrio sp.]|nr:hypothetical protein [Succinivibrio sp.]